MIIIIIGGEDDISGLKLKGCRRRNITDRRNIFEESLAAFEKETVLVVKVLENGDWGVVSLESRRQVSSVFLLGSRAKLACCGLFWLVVVFSSHSFAHFHGMAWRLWLVRSLARREKNCEPSRIYDSK